jgi:hypothetical protein
MARLVTVHGIGQQLEGPETYDWAKPLRSGMLLAGREPIAANDIAVAFYGNIFRKKLGKAAGEVFYTDVDVEEGYEQDLLVQWWQAAAATEPQVPGEGADTKARTPLVVQRALNALSHSRFFAGLADHIVIWNLKQVHRYFADPEIRATARGSVAKAVGDDTRVIVGHSLGSVVAYEALAEHPEWPVRALVTLGSPLGIRNLIFDRLQPAPSGGVGGWPGSVVRWTNIAAPGDVVALVKQLSTCFGDGVEDVLVDNETKAHDASAYLTAEEAGDAIAAGLVA